MNRRADRPFRDDSERLLASLQLAVDALIEIRDGRFQYNMGDYEACAKGSAFRALNRIEDWITPMAQGDLPVHPAWQEIQVQIAKLRAEDG